MTICTDGFGKVEVGKGRDRVIGRENGEISHRIFGNKSFHVEFSSILNESTDGVVVIGN